MVWRDLEADLAELFGDIRQDDEASFHMHLIEAAASEGRIACEKCGQPIPDDKRRGTRYCGPGCWGVKKRKRDRAKHKHATIVDCQTCGTPFIRPARRKPQIYCSVECRVKAERARRWRRNRWKGAAYGA